MPNISEAERQEHFSVIFIGCNWLLNTNGLSELLNHTTRDNVGYLESENYLLPAKAQLLILSFPLLLE